MATLQQLGQLALAQTRYNELIQFYTHNVTPTTAAMLGTSQINTAALLQQMFGMAQVPRGLDMLLRYFFYWVQDTRPYNQPVIPFPGAHPAVSALSALAEMLNKPEQERRRVLRRMSEFAKHVAIFLVYPMRTTPTHANTGQSIAGTGSSGLSSQERHRKCLERDGHRCVITRAFDENIFIARIQAQGPGQAMDDDGNVLVPGTEIIDQLEAAHIIPRSVCLGHGSGLNDAQKNTLNILNMFNPNAVQDLVSDTGVDKLSNLITLTRGMHASFGQLYVWFEPQPTMGKHNYRVQHVLGPNAPPRFPQQVAFRTNNVHPQDIPSAQLLAIHAACVRIAHASGAAKAVQVLLDKFDDSHAETDGSTPLDTLVAQRILFGRDCAAESVTRVELG